MLELVVSHDEAIVVELSQGCMFIFTDESAAVLVPFEGVPDGKLLNDELRAYGWEALDDTEGAMEFYEYFWDGVWYEGMLAHCVAITTDEEVKVA